MNYTKKTFTGLAWVTAGRGAVRSATVIKTIILARLLSPAQFGLFGIAALVLSFLEIITETGINVFLIQEKAGLDEYLSTAWITSILRGLVISLILVAVAYPVSLFFNSPQVLSLILLSSLIPFIRGFINPSVISLQKNLQFGREFIIKSVITAIELGVAILVALYTRSATALVWSMIASSLSEVIITQVFIAPRPEFRWDKHKFLKVISRGKWVTLSGLFNYLFQEGDDIAVGKFIDTVNLGLYQTAYKIAILPLSEIVDVFGRVTFPIFAELSSDIVRLRRAFYKTSLTVWALTFPISLVIFLYPLAIINLLLGPQWSPAAPALQVLAVFAFIRALSGPSSALFMGVKKQHYVTIVTLFSLFGLAITIIPLTLLYGLVGAAYSALIGSIVALPVIVYCLWKVLFTPPINVSQS